MDVGENVKLNNSDYNTILQLIANSDIKGKDAGYITTLIYKIQKNMEQK